MKLTKKKGIQNKWVGPT